MAKKNALGAAAKIAETASEGITPTLQKVGGASIEEKILMVGGVLFAATLAAHYWLGVGKPKLTSVKNSWGKSI